MMIKPIQPFPALLIKRGKRKTLVIADLHIGWEVPLSEEGIHVPSQTPKLQQKLEEVIAKAKPHDLLVLGDVKHTIAKAEIEEWRDVPEFFESLKEKFQNFYVIPGNHDGNLEPLLPEYVEILPSTGIRIGDVGLFHGHTWPSPELLSCKTLVMGHLHPVVVFRDPLGFKITSQVWVKAKVDQNRFVSSLLKRMNVKMKGKRSIKVFEMEFGVKVRTSELIIIPAFNDFLGGQPVNTARVARENKYKEFIGPVLRSGCINMDFSELYLLDGTFIGKLRQVKF